MSAPFDRWAGAFRAAGGTHCFGIPGGGDSLQIGDAVLRGGGEFVVTGHEMTAALMAGGFSAISRRPAICTSIKGPGFANMFPGLLCNAYEAFPMLALCEAYPDTTPRRHKWLEHGRLMAAFERPRIAFEDNEANFLQAWGEACREQPGPVLLDMGGTPSRIANEGAPCGENRSIAVFLDAVARAERPVVIAGSAMARLDLGSALDELQCPVFTTPCARGLIDESGPFAAGVFTGAGTEITPERDLLQRADLIIAFSLRQGEILGDIPHPNLLRVETGKLLQVFPPEPDAAQGTRLNRDQIFEIIQAIRSRPSWGGEEIAEAKRRLSAAVASEGWSPGAIAGRFGSDEDRFAHVLDTGNFTVLAEHLLPARHGNRIIGTPNSRWMGAGVGLALGASFACCKGADHLRGVVLWIGDGGIRSLGLELRIAIERHLPLLVLLMEDGYFGSVRGRVSAEHLREGPLAMGGPQVSSALESCGFVMAVAKEEAGFDAALQSWQEDPVPSCIRCQFDPSVYERVGTLLR